MALRLEDIELIRRVKYRYWRCIDTGDVDGLRDVFTEDVEVDYIGGSYRWQISGREAMLQAIAESFNPQAIACHTGHHPEIDVLSDTTARGIWYLTDVFINLRTNQLTTGSALYRDQYVKLDGAWKIKVTTYERLYERVEPFTDHSQITAHYLAKVKPPAGAGAR